MVVHLTITCRCLGSRIQEVWLRLDGSEESWSVPEDQDDARLVADGVGGMFFDNRQGIYLPWREHSSMNGHEQFESSISYVF